MTERLRIPPADLAVNVTGFLRGGLGLGEASRLYVAALQAAGLPISTTTVDPKMPLAGTAKGASPVSKTVDFEDLAGDGHIPFNLICVNPPEMPAVYAGLGTSFFQGRHSIGVLAWEVDKVPAEWSYTFDLLDEIWVYSRYVEEIFKAAEPGVPVMRLPLPAIAKPATGVDAPDFGLGQGFTFLFLFDFNSTMQRKNPAGVIEAFTRAFRPGEGPRLLLKSINGDFKPDRFRELSRLSSRHPDVHLVDEYVTAAEKDALIASCDCYVSLHRAEGFGLPLAEAMAVGKPVVATRFSGNLDFMTEENSFLVDCTRTTVGPAGEHYPADGHWAEPDLDHAAALMRQVWEQPKRTAERAERGRSDVLEMLSVEAVGDAARTRLEEVVAEGAVGVRPAGRHRPPPPPAGLAPLLHAEAMASHDPADYIRRMGRLKSVWRLLVLRVMRPFTAYQAGLNASVIDTMREVVDRLGVVHGDLLDLESQSGIVETRDLGRMIAGMRARPASAHPAISHRDEQGRVVLGFDRSGDPVGAPEVGFEDVFRGSEAQIAARQRIYPDLLGTPAWVLNLGCGKGEFLDMLRDRGGRGVGVELSQELVDHCASKGHKVVHDDALSYLESLDDDSVPAVFAAQVVEHLPAEALRRLLSLTAAKLVPGGTAVFETVNPHTPTALKAFWTDPTHHHPLYPEVLIALARFAGFATGEVVFPSSRGDFNEDIYESPDYAVVLTAMSP